MSLPLVVSDSGSMWLGGNPDDLRRCAAELRGLCEAVAGEFAHAQNSLASMQWESAAAHSFHVRAVGDFAVYDRSLGAVREAAFALDHVATALSERQQRLIDLATVVGLTTQELWNGALAAGEDVLTYGSGLLEDVAEGTLSAITGGLW